MRCRTVFTPSAALQLLQLLLLLLQLACSTHADTTSSAVNETVLEAWTKFKANFRKNYDSGEDALRLKLWLESALLVEQHNAERNGSRGGFTLSLNGLADWTQSEYQRLLGFRPQAASMQQSVGRPRIIRPPNGPPHGPPVGPGAPTYIQTVPTSSLLPAVNWTAQGRVNPVQNQGQCGDCWAFAACGAMEGQYAANGSATIMSEQNLLDCTASYGNAGCNGGTMEAAFSYVMDNKGIDSYHAYPYTGAAGSCRYSSATSVGYMAGYEVVAAGDELALQQAVALIGPIAVGLDASLNSFQLSPDWLLQLYSSGVYKPIGCSTNNLDHAVLVTGYGTLNGQDYWLIKNSWGTQWGMDGYMLLARNDGNMCGVASQASFPFTFTPTGVGALSPSSPEQAGAAPSGSEGRLGPQSPLGLSAVCCALIYSVLGITQ